MTDALAIASVVTEISQTAKQLGAEPTAGVREVTQAVAALERKRMKVHFDHAKFIVSLDAIRESRRIESQKELAKAIGVGDGVVGRIYAGKPIDAENLLAVIAWSQLDLRKFLSENGVA